MNRRDVLAAGAAMVLATRGAAAQEAWYDIAGDDGRPVENLRIPVEIAVEADALPDVIRTGAAQPDVRMVEFFDYNCPYCRAAAGDIEAMIVDQPDLQLVLVNNPVLSRWSREAALVQIAVVQSHGEDAGFQLHRRLFAAKGKVDGARALAAAGEMGLATAELEAAARSDRAGDVLNRHMSLAASMGFAATPSFLVADAGILGYPGPGAMNRIAAAVRQCGAVVC
ncbi:DsbA family protein [Alsobacter sp. SYSU M60028]|uniref:DsbA family protein n=1 Tax=Alsobacter ponti TaxID=2962936 RepID=A0ABT1L8T2_9HYPH|nr:DsbA family protein [Alsobacter ponti]MCP8937145.1 DsbA family protein [Alsobacter ponti]